MYPLKILRIFYIEVSDNLLTRNYVHVYTLGCIHVTAEGDRQLQTKASKKKKKKLLFLVYVKLISQKRK